jgi:PAS domain S-box-containing protein
MVKIKPRISISTKIFLLSLLTGVVVFSAFIASSLQIDGSIFDESYKDKAAAITTSLDAGIGINDLNDQEKLQSIINKIIFLNPEIYLLNISVAENNQLIIEASNQPGLIGQQPSNENVDSYSNDIVIHKKITLDNNESGIENITPIFISGQKMGTYELRLSTQQKLLALQQRMLTFLGLISLFVFFASMTFFLVVRKTIILPIRNLITATNQISEGKFDNQISISSNDEIGDLANAFQDSSLKLSDLYHNLESKVSERTAELAAILDKNQNTKVAMLNLLEDAKDLEKQLTEEKAGVEKKVEDRTFELSESNARLQSAIDSVPRIFVVFDKDKKIILHNNRMNEILQSKETDWTTEKISQILGEKIELNKKLNEVIKSGKLIHVRDFDFGSRFLSVYIGPVIPKGESSPIGAVMTIEDITEKTIMERSKDEFFSIASHELRTPLTAIRGNTSMILEYYADAIKEPELKAMVDDVHESSIRLINIVNDFLNVSRLEQSRMVYDTKEFDVAEIIPETIKEYNVTGSRQKLSLDYLPPQTKAPMVLADADKVRQVIINLLGNAIKFTDKGGITITTETLPNFVKVLITDTGRGIPLKQQSLLFHKFQQAGASLFTRDTAGGSGLGLYISKMMVEGMGGEIKLEKSEIDKGSTFSFSLPIATKENKVDRLAKLGLARNTKVDNTKTSL